jgi:hypothetical protein
MEWINAEYLPDHKEEVIVKLKDHWDDNEVYITGGYYDRDSSEWHVWGFDISEKHYYVDSYFVIPGIWFRDFKTT